MKTKYLALALALLAAGCSQDEAASLEQSNRESSSRAVEVEARKHDQVMSKDTLDQAIDIVQIRTSGRSL